MFLRCSALVFGLRQLNLHPVDPVDAVDEQDQYEDERDLCSSQPESIAQVERKLPSCHIVVSLPADSPR